MLANSDMCAKQPEQLDGQREIESLITRAANIAGGLSDLNSQLNQVLDRIRMPEPAKEDDSKARGLPDTSFGRMEAVLEGANQTLQLMGIKIGELEKYI